MNSHFKLASIISVLAILLWFVFYAFNTSSNTSKSHPGGVAYNPQEHTAEGFAAFEDLKALQRAEKKAKEKKKTEKSNNESNEEQGTPTITTPQSTRLSASGLASRQPPLFVAKQIPQAHAPQALVSRTQAAQKTTPASNNIQAIEAILSVENSANCQENYVAAVFFGKNSASIRGKSLLDLDELIQEHRKCLDSLFYIKSTVSEESTYMLDQRRRDEVKYYLLQRRVEKAAISLNQ